MEINGLPRLLSTLVERPKTLSHYTQVASIHFILCNVFLLFASLLLLSFLDSGFILDVQLFFHLSWQTDSAGCIDNRYTGVLWQQCVQGEGWRQIRQVSPDIAFVD